MRSERLGPPVAARISAYAALALHEGYAADVRSGARSFAPVVNGMPEREGTSLDGSVDGAIVAARTIGFDPTGDRAAGDRHDGEPVIDEHRCERAPQ